MNKVKLQPFSPPGKGSGVRRGAAMIGMIVVLAVLTLFISLITFQIVAHRRYLQHRQYQAQAQWLARAGVEYAAAQLLASAKLESQTIDLIPLGSVRIDFQREKDIVRITSEAKYPSDLLDGVIREVTRSFRRSEADGKVRLEAVP